MADPRVKFTFTGDAAEVERIIARMEGRIAQLDARLQRVPRAGNALHDVTKRNIDSVATMALKYAALPALIMQAVDAQRQFNQEAAETNRKLSEQEQKLRVQGGLTALQGQEAQRRVLATAYRNAVSSDVANAAAVQLISSGFSVEDATGAGLDVTLGTLAASNKFGEDPTQLVQAAGQFLAATGQEKNAANLRQLLVSGQGLFQQTDFQISDLTQLASKVGGLSGQDPTEILAAYDVIRNTTNAERASTALKIFGERLSGASGDRIREEQIRKLGLKPEQVDLVGESLPQVIETIGSRIDALPEEQRQPLLQRLFGTEASSSIGTLLQNRGDLAGTIAKARDTRGFEAAVEAGTSGYAAGVRRQELEAEFTALQNEQDNAAVDAARKERELEMRRRGANPFLANLSLGAERYITDPLNNLLGITTGTDIGRQQFEQRTAGADQATSTNKELVDLLTRIETNTREARRDAAGRVRTVDRTVREPRATGGEE